MDDSHDGSDSGSSSPPPATRVRGKALVLRTFAWKHDQAPLDAARPGDFNLAVRSHDHTASLAALDGGRGRSSAAAAATGGSDSKPAHGARGASDVSGAAPAMPPADKPAERRQRVLVAFKNGRRPSDAPEMMMMKAEAEAAAAYAAASRTDPDGAVRSPPATAELTDDRKPRRRIYPVPHAGDQGVGSSGSAPSPSKKPAPSSHRRKAAKALDIDDSEAIYQLGLEVALMMSPAELKAAVDKFLSLEDLPKSERVSAMQRRDEERPPFDFRLDKEQAMADVMAVLKHKKCCKNK